MKSCFRKIHDRGAPKTAVVADIIRFVKSAPDSVFEVNSKRDIYSHVAKELGPYTSLKHRRAVMADVLIVLSGFESSWDYSEGRDLSANNVSSCTEEAGIYQTSANSSSFGGDLKNLLRNKCVNYAGSSCAKFIACTKNDKAFAHEYTARLLRHTTAHHGPLVRREVNKWLSKSCVSEIEGML